MKSIKEKKVESIETKYELYPPFPREIFLDLNNTCNHTCVFCANPKLPTRKIMDKDFAFRMLKEAHEAGARQAALYASGEPFLVKYLAECVAYAKQVGYEYLFITSNGAMATPERAKAVLDAGLDSIKFSIHGATRETYKKVHGEDDFDKVIANVKWISEYRKKSGLQYRIYASMVYTHENRHEEKMLQEILAPYIDDFDPHILTNQCGNMLENNEIGDIEPGNIRGRAKVNICWQPFKSFTITPDGLMSGCVIDYQKELITADLKKMSLKEAWHNTIYTEWRRKHLEGNLKGLICQNCVHNTNEPVTPLMPEFAQPFSSTT